MPGCVTRSLLLDTAHLLFVDQGYAATSTRQIAENAGLALDSIYNHFVSKEAIFHAILIERHPYQQIMPSVQKIQAESGNPIDRSAIRDLLNELGHYPNFFNLMLVEMVEFKGSHPPELFENVLCGVSPPAWMRVLIGMFVS
jgi:AcrR family transcriptional regulator